jgi:hypothetical protein
VVTLTPSRPLDGAVWAVGNVTAVAAIAAAESTCRYRRIQI